MCKTREGNTMRKSMASVDQVLRIVKVLNKATPCKHICPRHHSVLLVVSI